MTFDISADDEAGDLLLIDGAIDRAYRAYVPLIDGITGLWSLD